MPGINRDWLDLEHYIAIHEQCLQLSCEYFVENADLIVPRVKSERIVRIRGDLFCKGDLVIHVDKSIEIDDRRRARGFLYRYQAQFVTFPPLRQVFRYDNDHVYVREGHPDAYHKHVFSTVTWKETAVVHIGRENWPTLQKVIDELFDWWQEHKDDERIYPPTRRDL